MGALLEQGGSGIEPVQRLSEAQRRVIFAYASQGSVDAAAVELGISPQTVKNHLTACYKRLGARSGTQAVFLVMGGDAVLDTLPPPATPEPRSRTTHRLRLPARVARRIEELKQTSHDLRAANAQLQIRLRRAEGGPMAALPRLSKMPDLVDGEISIQQLRRVDLVANAEAERGSLQATLGEWADFLDHYVRSPGRSARRRVRAG